MNEIAELLRKTGTDPENLSAKIGIDADRIQALLAGAEPSMAEVRRLSDAFRVSLVDLTAPRPSERRADMLFRSSLKAKAGSRDQIIAAFSKKMA
jgi:hypothetical protein